MNYGRILGIDIGSSTVKVISGIISNDNEVAVAGIGTAPLWGLEKGVVTDSRALSVSIKNAIECIEVATDENYQSAFIGISSVVLNSFNSSGTVVPLLEEKITESDIDRACTAAIVSSVPQEQMVLHILPQGFRVDGETMYQMPVGRKGECLEVAAHVVTISRELTETLNAVLNELKISLLGIYSNAILSSKVVPLMEGNNLLYFDMGSGVTDIVLYHQGVVFFSVTLPIGGSYITSDIALGLDTNFSNAEEIKWHYGCYDSMSVSPEQVLDLADYGVVDKHVTYEFLNKVVESRVEEIVRILQKYLEPVLTQFAIDNITITGGAAALPSMEKWFKSIFKLPVKVVLPEQLAAEYRSPSHTAGYGIICHGAMELSENIEKKDQKQHRTLFRKIRNILNI